MEAGIHIYSLSDPRTGQIRYVGKALNPFHRIRKHLCDKRSSHKTNWIQSLLCIGLKPSIDILETVPEGEWQEAERFWIAYLRFLGCPLTNLDNGGWGVAKLTPEIRRKMSQSRTGLKASEAARRNISAALKGRKLSSEHAAKAAEASKMLGKRHSEETRRKMSAAQKGRTFTIEQRRRISESAKARWARA